MELDELQDHMETMMGIAYHLASLPIEAVIARLKQPMILKPTDPELLPRKNDLMIKIFEECLKVKKFMIEIQPEVKAMKQLEEGDIHRA